ncbi:MAG: RNA methyltransferase [Acidobacteriota bacterium]|nr:RNA methyltransferase [Acidobacteriota bacterium]
MFRLPEALKSSSHPLVRQARLLGRQPRRRREAGLFLIEGPTALAEALAAGSRPVWVLVASPHIGQEPYRSLIQRLLGEEVPVQPVQRDLLERTAPTSHGPGLLAACRLPATADDPRTVLDRRTSGLVVVCWKIQDPGNLGTLVRSAAAFGAGGLVAVAGADPWSPKAVRSSAGAIHRLPTARATDAAILLERLEQDGQPLVAALPRGGVTPSALSWEGAPRLLLGAEVAGLPEALVSAATTVSIPMEAGSESLSVAVAGSILLETAARLRRKDISGAGGPTGSGRPGSQDD